MEKKAIQARVSVSDYIQMLEKIPGFTDMHKLRGTMEGDIYPKSEDEPYNLGQEEAGVFDNVKDHTAKALLITDVYGEAFGLSEEERGALNEASWNHDSGKKTERMWQRAIEEAEQQNGELIKEEAIELSLPGKRKVVALKNTAEMEEWENAEAGISRRANALMKANIPPSLEGHGNDLAAKVMWFADACLTGTTIQSIGSRFDALENDPKNGQRNIEFSNSYKEKYNGKSLFDVQRALGNKYEAEFAGRLGIAPTEIYSWLTVRVENKLQSREVPLLPRK